MSNKRKYCQEMNEEPDAHDAWRRRIVDDGTLYALYIIIMQPYGDIMATGLDWIGGDIGERYLLGLFDHVEYTNFVANSLMQKAESCGLNSCFELECVKMEPEFFNGSGMYINHFYTHAVDNMEYHISLAEMDEYLKGSSVLL